MARGGDGSRSLHTRVKNTKVKESSRRWLERHLNDPYVKRSKMDGYRSRAAYKFLEINERHKLVKKGDRVVDLGAAPGGWSQIVSSVTGSTDEAPRVVAIDYLDIDPIPGVIILKKDFLDEDAPAALMAALGGAPDLVISDMAAPTVGHRQTDHIRTMHLVEVAADFAISVLKPGGHFLAKAFQGGTERELLTLLKQRFASVHHVKPPASRQESVESFILAKGFKGRGVSGAGMETA
ncbi:MAG: RlmE family RNA methyltransferase [Rhizobiaceae bacterium]|nr:RlmE family RNA methyltransferase [Rhizobiaceae bacterium]